MVHEGKRNDDILLRRSLVNAQEPRNSLVHGSNRCNRIASLFTKEEMVLPVGICSHQQFNSSTVQHIKRSKAHTKQRSW